MRSAPVTFFVRLLALGVALSACSLGSSAPENGSGGGGSISSDGEDGAPPVTADSITTDSTGPGELTESFEGMPPVDWTVFASIEPAQFIDQTVSYSVLDFGAVPDDGADDGQAFFDAIEQLNRTGGVLDIPAGQYHLNRELRLPSRVILRGEGNTTVLNFNLQGADADLITAGGQVASDWVGLSVDAVAGSTTIELSADPGVPLEQGDIIEIERDNGDEMFTSPEWDVDWDDGSVGEIAEVVSADGTTVVIDHPLLATYPLDRNSKFRVLDAARFVGIESLRIEREDTGYGSIIRFTHAADVWVDDIETHLATRAHIEADLTYRCQISGSLLHEAHDYGDGGRAYGVSLARHTTGCTVENNTLYDHRHAMIIQLGASGNVFAYNHARGSAGYEDRQPRADISLHGHWPHANLFEGNVVDRVVFADWWGPSGPFNTLHRNCVLDSVVVADGSNQQYLIGNIVGDQGLTIEDGISGTTEIANRIQGTPVNEAGSPPSLFAASPPAYLADSTWPLVAPESGNAADRDRACAVPAGERSPLGVG